MTPEQEEAVLVAADLYYLNLKQSGELQRIQEKRDMRQQIQENFRNYQEPT